MALAPSRFLLLLGLLGVFTGSSLLFALAWMPIWLAPFVVTLRRTMLLGVILALLPLTYGLETGSQHESQGRLSRLYLRPLPWRSLFITTPFLCLAVIVGQIVLIERNPNLTLIQYLREEIWVLWLLMPPAALLWLAGHLLWLQGRRESGPAAD
ncbi:hypothetical protein H8E07_15960 [bacterium]|nr:hypothetical protein [bacterium]